MVGDDDRTLEHARARVVDEMGGEALIDAAAVASNFERMVRIADSTGIPIDGMMVAVSEDVREELELSRFGSSVNTPETTGTQRALSKVARPLLIGGMRLARKLRRR